MKLIVGLGNPGKKYVHTRHNIGFMILDKLVKDRGLKWKKDKRYSFAGESNTLFLKPSTYMNLSGLAVKRALDKHPVSGFVVIYDDIYLSLGEVRVREKGSNGGHKGVLSIIEVLGDNMFPRIRVGIGTPQFTELSDYVLEDFAEEELSVLSETKDFTCSLIEQFVNGDYKQMIDYYSKNNVSYSERIRDLSESKTKGGKNE